MKAKPMVEVGQRVIVSAGMGRVYSGEVTEIRENGFWITTCCYVDNFVHYQHIQMIGYV